MVYRSKISNWVSLFSVFFLFSCEYDKLSVQPAIQPVVSTTTTSSTPTTCDSIPVSYTKDIIPILQLHCYSCHSPTYTHYTGVDLENYTSLRSYMNSYYYGDGVFGSQFYHTIKKSFGVVPMPPNNDKLSDCEASKVHEWILNNAPNN